MGQPSDVLRQILLGTARGFGSLRPTRCERQPKRENQCETHGADWTGSSLSCQLRRRSRGTVAPRFACYDLIRMVLWRRLSVIVLCLCFGGDASAQTATVSPPLADLSRSLQELSAKVSPSVVQIFVTGYPAPDEENQNATTEPQLERSSGSG